MSPQLRRASESIRAMLPPRLHRAARACATDTAGDPPEAPSLSLEELHSSTAGGASAFNRLERGAELGEMIEFWRSNGLHDGLASTLAARSVSDGGVWGDPPTLASRLLALQKMLPLIPLHRLLRKHPDVVQSRAETVQLKLDALSRMLPAVNVLQMVARYPPLLRRSVARLEERTAALLRALPRPDMPQVICDAPQLLDLSPNELDKRAAAIRFSYVTTSIVQWRRERLLRLLRTPSHRLRRLEHVDSLNPHLRTAVPDARLLRMDDELYRRRFVAKKHSRWRRRPGALQEVRSRAERFSFLPTEHVPKLDPSQRGSDIGLLAWGREQAQARLCHGVEHERDGTAVAQAEGEDTPRRIDSGSPLQLHVSTQTRK